MRVLHTHIGELKGEFLLSVDLVFGIEDSFAGVEYVVGYGVGFFRRGE